MFGKYLCSIFNGDFDRKTENSKNVLHGTTLVLFIIDYNWSFIDQKVEL